MGDDKGDGTPLLRVRLDVFHELFARLFVEGARRLVEEQASRLPQKRPRDAHPLELPLADVLAVLFEHHVEPVLFDEGFQAAQLDGALHLLLREFVPHAEILIERILKHKVVLADVLQLVIQRFLAQFLHGRLVVGDAAAEERVGVLFDEELEERALAAAAVTAHRDDVAPFGVQFAALQELLFAAVGVFLDVDVHARDVSRVLARIALFGVEVQKVAHAAVEGFVLGEHPDGARQQVERVGEIPREHIDDEEGGSSHLLFEQDGQRADDDAQDGQQITHKDGEHHLHGEEAVSLELCPDRTLVSALILFCIIAALFEDGELHPPLDALETDVRRVRPFLRGDVVLFFQPAVDELPAQEVERIKHKDSDAHRPREVEDDAEYGGRLQDAAEDGGDALAEPFTHLDGVFADEVDDVARLHLAQKLVVTQCVFVHLHADEFLPLEAQPPAEVIDEKGIGGPYNDGGGKDQRGSHIDGARLRNTVDECLQQKGDEDEQDDFQDVKYHRNEDGRQQLALHPASRLFPIGAPCGRDLSLEIFRCLELHGFLPNVNCK